MGSWCTCRFRYSVFFFYVDASGGLGDSSVGGLVFAALFPLAFLRALRGSMRHCSGPVRGDIGAAEDLGKALILFIAETVLVE